MHRRCAPTVTGQVLGRLAIGSSAASLCHEALAARSWSRSDLTSPVAGRENPGLQIGRLHYGSGCPWTFGEIGFLQTYTLLDLPDHISSHIFTFSMRLCLLWICYDLFDSV